MPPLPTNSQNLPYPDPIHPIVVHFIIAMVLFSFLCDLIGYFTDSHHFFEVSFWNLFVATLAIFVAILFGQFEAGLANVYAASKSTLNLHTIIGWSLSAILVATFAWRLVIRNHNPLRIPRAYLGVATVVSFLVCFQTYLGSQLVWVYGFHVSPVIQAKEQGILK